MGIDETSTAWTLLEPCSIEELMMGIFNCMHRPLQPRPQESEDAPGAGRGTAERVSRAGGEEGLRRGVQRHELHIANSLWNIRYFMVIPNSRSELQGSPELSLGLLTATACEPRV